MTEQLEAPFGNEFANRQVACAPPYFSVRHVLAPVHTAELSEAGLITCIQFGAFRLINLSPITRDVRDGTCRLHVLH